MTGLVSLPFDLWPSILDLAGPTSAFNLALVCRYLCSCSSPWLSRHREYCQEHFEAASDRLPDTLPALLRDPVARFYARSLEIYTSRHRWSDWAPWPSQASSERNLTYDSSFFSQHELDNFCHIMGARLGLDDASVQDRRSRICDGDDGALKALAIALCPRLQSVYFVAYGHAVDASQDHCLQILGSALRAIGNPDDDPGAEEAHPGALAWPPGLSSLRSLAVGVGCREATRNLEAAHYGTYEVRGPTLAPLFLFPNLESLFISGASFGNGVDDPDPDDLDLPQGCSSIKTLFLDSSHPPPELVETLVQASADLKELAFQRCDLQGFDFDQLFQWVPSELDRLVSYDCQCQGYRSAMYDLDELRVPCKTVHILDFLSLFTDVKQIDKRLDDIEEFYETLPFDRSTVYTDEFDPAEFLAQIGGVYLWSQSDVVVWVGSPDFRWCSGFKKLFPRAPSDEELWEILDQAFARMVEKGKFSECRAFNLMGIERGSRDKISFQRTIKAGQRAGVPVYTRTTKLPRDLGKLLPVGATENDLKNSPSEGQGREFYLDPFRGMVDGCRNCGACDACFAVYPKHLWDSRDWV